jgi:Animal haem peroxidase
MKPKPPVTSAHSSATRPHGVLRGLDSTRHSHSLEGRFGRMFRTLPAARFSEAALIKLGAQMTAAAEATPTPETEHDPEENAGISAGYTYFGQFIDHDLTFDPASSLQKQNDPDSLIDYRTPKFDLDNLYGRGPSDQPYLYRDDGLHMLLGKKLTGNDKDPNTRGVPRNTPEGKDPARALIGDPRNDENVIVSNLQASFLRFHNRVVDFQAARDGKAPAFEDAQRVVRWHYQWAVLHDFLPTIIGDKTLADILPHIQHKSNPLQDPPRLKFYSLKGDSEAYMPVEFSVAAYRFGHSMIRPIYRINLNHDRIPIFARTPPCLVGFYEFAADLAVDWSLFFKMTGSGADLTKERVQPAYKPDTSLVNPLGDLPASVASNPPPVLAERNLLRGLRMGLPSGQTVAKHMGVTVIPDNDLIVGKASTDPADQKDNLPLTKISSEFEDNAPLWFYILAEGYHQFAKDPKDTTPIRLGPVGGRIVGEVFVGLLLADSHSYLRQDPSWKPIPDFCNKTKKFGIAELLTQSMQA